MKEIQKTFYVANDGTEFISSTKCSRYEKALDITKELPKALDPLCEFANGGGYIQHDITAVQKVEDRIWKLICQEFPSLKDKGLHDGIVGRVLSDSSSALYSPYCRLLSIDTCGREWGQPYFAKNPGKGKNKVWARVK